MSGLCLALGASVIMLGSQVTVISTTYSTKTVMEEDYRPLLQLVELTTARASGVNVKKEIPRNALRKKTYWEFTPIFNKYSRVTLDYLPNIKPYKVCVSNSCKALNEIFPAIRENEVVDLLVCN